MISHQQQQQQRAAYDAAIADVNVAAELVANAERALERAIAGKLSPRFVERRERELADARQLLAGAQHEHALAVDADRRDRETCERQRRYLARQMRAARAGRMTREMRAELDAERRANAV
jgi:hypothetical protein